MLFRTTSQQHKYNFTTYKIIYSNKHQTTEKAHNHIFVLRVDRVYDGNLNIRSINFKLRLQFVYLNTVQQAIIEEKYQTAQNKQTIVLNAK